MTIGKGADRFRPTSERTREAVINKLRGSLSGAMAADFCAGSGAVGFEMIGCGAAHVHFVEKERIRADQIRRHASELGVQDRCSVFAVNVRRFLEEYEYSYDIVYFDPPYDAAGMMELVPLIVARLNRGGVLVYERRRGSPESVDNGNIRFSDRRQYGETAVEYYDADVLGGGTVV